MNYVCYELDEDPESSLSLCNRLISKITDKMAPLINPDFHKKYDDVVYWWLELDQENVPQRELGFDQNGNTIVAGPFGRNKGLFTHARPKVNAFYAIEMYQFIEQWESFKGVHQQ